MAGSSSSSAGTHGGVHGRRTGPAFAGRSCPQAWLPPPSCRGAATVARRIRAVNDLGCRAVPQGPQSLRVPWPSDRRRGPPPTRAGAGCATGRAATGRPRWWSARRPWSGSARPGSAAGPRASSRPPGRARRRCRWWRTPPGRRGSRPAPGHVVERPLRDLQGHERLDAEPGGGDVHVRPETGDHAGLLEPLEPRGGRRPGDAEDPGDLLQAGPRFSRSARSRATSSESSGASRPCDPSDDEPFRELSTLHSSTAGSLDRLRRFVSPRHPLAQQSGAGVL